MKSESEKVIILLKAPALRNFIINENDINSCLEILFTTHMSSKSFDIAIKKTNLQNVLNENLHQYSQLYKNRYNNFVNTTKIMEFSTWLVKENKESYKQIAVELLAVVLNKDPNALEVIFSIHYGIKSNAVKKIASEVYEYMDNQSKMKIKM